MRAIRKMAAARGYSQIVISVRGEWSDGADEPWQWIAEIRCEDSTGVDSFSYDRGSIVGPDDALDVLMANLWC